MEHGKAVVCMRPVFIRRSIHFCLSSLSWSYCSRNLCSIGVPSVAFLVFSSRRAGAYRGFRRRKYFPAHFARIPLFWPFFHSASTQRRLRNWLRIGLGPSQERLRLDSGYNPSGCVGHQCLAAVPLSTQAARRGRWAWSAIQRLEHVLLSQLRSIGVPSVAFLVFFATLSTSRFPPEEIFSFSFHFARIPLVFGHFSTSCDRLSGGSEPAQDRLRTVSGTAQTGLRR